jgi:hypothetical protein
MAVPSALELIGQCPTACPDRLPIDPAPIHATFCFVALVMAWCFLTHFNASGCWHFLEKTADTSWISVTTSSL